jgi:hypothetical protein
VVPDAPARFAALLGGYRLAGGLGHGNGPPLGVHRTAYALGTMNLLADVGASGTTRSMRPISLRQ